MRPRILTIVTLISLFLVSTLSWAPDIVRAATNQAVSKKGRYKLENEFVKLGLYLRTPSQMAAFYEGRGFPKKAIDETTKYCFITIGMRNISKQKIWLDLTQWRIYDDKGDIKRTSRAEWKQTWQQLKVPLASQATFNWTLLPEARDLHPDEPAGGNITLQPTYTPFTIEASFATGEDKQGKPLMIKIDNVRCLKNGEESAS